MRQRHHDQSIDESKIDKSINQPINTHSKQVINQPISQSTNQQPSVFDFVGHFNALFHRSNEPINQPSNQSIDQSNRPLTSSYLPCLDGLRAHLSINMIIYHCYAFLIYHITNQSTDQLFGWLPVRLGPLLVDWFFVLTGLLTILPICIQEQQSIKPSINDQSESKTGQSVSPSTNQSIISFDRSKFVYRRFVRLFPLWALTFFIHRSINHAKMMDASTLRNDGLMRLLSSDESIMQSINQSNSIPSMCSNDALLIGQFALINQWLPFGGCQGSTWSIGVQMQFLLFFPMLYHYYNQSTNQSINQAIAPTRRMLPLLKLLLIGWLMIRVLAFFSVLTAPLIEMEGAVVFFFWYSNTSTRIGSVLIGWLVAMILTASTNNQSKFARFAIRLRRSLADQNNSLIVVLMYCTLIGVVYHYSVMSMEGPGGSLIGRAQMTLIVDHNIFPTFPPSINQLMVIQDYALEMFLYVFAIAGGPLINVLIGSLIISLIVSPSNTLMGQCRSYLEHSRWSSISTLSYAAYLVHPTLQSTYFHYIVQHINPDFDPSVVEFLCHAALMVGVSFTIALVLHVFYDAPMVGWLSRDNGTKRRLMYWYALICMLISGLAHCVGIPLMLLYAPKEVTKARYSGF